MTRFDVKVRDYCFESIVDGYEEYLECVSGFRRYS